MRILIVGAGGVGNAITVGLARRDFFEHSVVACVALTRAEAPRDQVADPRVRPSAVPAAAPAGGPWG